MAQVPKPEVRARIEAAALRCFADRGYAGTSMAAIAAEAGTAPANLYRYVADKAALFAAVVPAAVAARHDELLDTRIAALTEGPDRRAAAAEELLEFWLDQRLAVVVLLDRADGTPLAGYPQAFVRRLVEHAARALDRPPPADARRVLEVVFDNTRRALAEFLRTAADREEARALVETFWRYQVPGLEALLAHVRVDGAATTGDKGATAVNPPRGDR